MSRRPNIVMILTDDHSANAISAYGSEVNVTPRIDEIGRRGVRFDRCYATNSLCAPSRASILTGTYSHVNGVMTLVTPIDASQPTFITQLREAGYRCAMVGKWHMGDGPGHDPQGFDYWDVFIEQGEYHNPRLLNADGLRTVEGYATDIVTDLSIDWVESLPPDAPWCVLIYHKAPHRPWQPDREVNDAEIPVPDTWDDDYATRSSSSRRALMRIAEHLNEQDLKQPVPEGLTYEEAAVWKYRRFMADYLAVVESVDENVGRVVDWLESRGDLDDTILMYASDQGFFLGEHGWFDKRFMYEESLQMPMLLQYPRGVGAGQEHSGFVTNVDFAQTLLEACGVPPHERMQGRSFWGDISDVPAEPPAEGVYYRYWEHDDVWHKAPAHYGYTDGHHKLIYFYNDGLGIPGCGTFTYTPEWELYDLDADPGEVTNVYGRPEYAALTEELKVKMWHAQEAVGDLPHSSQPVPPGCEPAPAASGVVTAGRTVTPVASD